MGFFKIEIEVFKNPLSIPTHMHCSLEVLVHPTKGNQQLGGINKRSREPQKTKLSRFYQNR